MTQLSPKARQLLAAFADEAQPPPNLGATPWPAARRNHLAKRWRRRATVAFALAGVSLAAALLLVVAMRLVGANYAEDDAASSMLPYESTATPSAGHVAAPPSTHESVKPRAVAAPLEARPGNDAKATDESPAAIPPTIPPATTAPPLPRPGARENAHRQRQRAPQRQVTPPAARPPSSDNRDKRSDTLAEEIRLLDAARDAVDSADRKAATEHLGAYRRRFPRGELAPEAADLRRRLADVKVGED